MKQGNSLQTASLPRFGTNNLQSALDKECMDLSYIEVQYMRSNTDDREWKKGSADLLILSLVQDQPRHGYDISKLIEPRSNRRLRVHVTSLYPLLYRLEERGWVKGQCVDRTG